MTHTLPGPVPDARLVCPLFPTKHDLPMSCKDLQFTQVDHGTFKTLNAMWHSRLPKVGGSQFRICYAAQFAGVFYAVAAWSNPVARLLPQLTWLELRRFAIAPDAPRYTASRMLSYMRKDIEQRFPEVERLISYQDLSAHTGTIYKASGWHEAENFKPRARGWIGWGNRPRKGRTNQAVPPRMRWELQLTLPGPARTGGAQGQAQIIKGSTVTKTQALNRKQGRILVAKSVPPKPRAVSPTGPG